MAARLYNRDRTHKLFRSLGFFESAEDGASPLDGIAVWSAWNPPKGADQSAVFLRTRTVDPGRISVACVDEATPEIWFCSGGGNCTLLDAMHQAALTRRDIIHGPHTVTVCTDLLFRRADDIGFTRKADRISASLIVGRHFLLDDGLIRSWRNAERRELGYDDSRAPQTLCAALAACTRREIPDGMLIDELLLSTDILD